MWTLCDLAVGKGERCFKLFCRKKDKNFWKTK